MAGGKETPRQKLIGIMYLILLALLALQVSSSIMEKFKFLDDSLSFANDNAEKKNDSFEKGIQETVAKNGNRSSDLAVLDKAKKVRDEAVEVRKVIEELRSSLVKVTGGLENPEEPSSMYKGAKAETEVEELMIGLNKNGKGYLLKKEINEYCDHLTKITGDKYSELALDGAEDKRISATEKDLKKKDFAELNFGQTPMVAAMAVLSNIESDVLKYETSALAKLAESIGADQVKFDEIFAAYNAESKVVAAGTKYKAELFLAASSSSLKPVYSADGRVLQVKDKKGLNEFTATPGPYDADGNCKKSWNGKISFKHNGKDTTFIVKGEYIVARPVIQIQSASVSALYRNCANELNVQVPALGSTYAPSFAGSTGGEFITGASRGLITIVPSAPEVTLKVASGGNAIGEQKFKVRLVPTPAIKFLINNAEANEKTGYSISAVRSAKIEVKGDESFTAFLPKDARYNASIVEVALARGARYVGAPLTFKSGNLDVSQLLQQARPGDRLIVDVKKVQRANFHNTLEDVKIPTIIKQVPLN